MDRVLSFLKQNNVMALATATDNKPRASTVEYYMVGDVMIFATDPNSIKANNLQHNKYVSISVHNMPKFVTVDGIVTKPTEAEIEKYNEQLFEHHPEFRDMLGKGTMKPFVYFKVKIETAYYNDYSKGMHPTHIIKNNQSA